MQYWQRISETCARQEKTPLHIYFQQCSSECKKKSSTEFKNNQLFNVSSILCTNFPLNGFCVSRSDCVYGDSLRHESQVKYLGSEVPYCRLKGCFSRSMLIHLFVLLHLYPPAQIFWAGKTQCRHTGSLSRLAFLACTAAPFTPC